MTTAPVRPARTAMSATVRRREQLTPDLVRIVLGGGDLHAFRPSQSTDSYVKIAFLDPDTTVTRPLDLDALKTQLPRDKWPKLRTYTVRRWDHERQELTLDFVVHGDTGLAGPWARSAAPGDEIFLLGPGGGYAPDAAAEWHLLVGDESALPAIAVALEALPAGADVRAFVEVEGPGHELDDLPGVTWVHRDGAPVGERLVAALRDADLPVGDPDAFVHGEAGFVKELRAWLRDRGVPRERLSISGYWRVGVDDEGWRAVKRDFDRD